MISVFASVAELKCEYGGAVVMHVWNIAWETTKCKFEYEQR
jgi:hypothetical protein